MGLLNRIRTKKLSPGTVESPFSGMPSGEKYDIDSDDLLAVRIGLFRDPESRAALKSMRELEDSGAGWQAVVDPKYVAEAMGYFATQDMELETGVGETQG
jgi:hypothetical protein